MEGDQYMKMLILRYSIFVLLLIASLSTAFSQEVGKITSLQGRVDAFTQNSQIALSARSLDKVSVGDSIRTKSDARVQITFRDGSILRLAPNSKVTITQYSLDDKSRRTQAQISLERGKMRTIIAKMPSSAAFEILTPNSQGTIKGSDIFTSFEAGKSAILVKEGTLTVANTLQPQSPLVVGAGNAVVIPMQNIPQGPRPYLEMEQKLFEQDTDVVAAPEKTNASIVNAVITKLQGNVSLITKGESKAHAAALGEKIQEGDYIETGDTGTVQISLDNNNGLNLKPKTKLSVIRLSFNPATGEYENLFDITFGTVKARIENLKGKSKFEVKTPTAICGARGTIIYVSVLPNGFTTLAVEGGNGYISNTQSGDSRDVSGGTQSSSDTSGNLSDPEPMSDDQRGSLDEGLGGQGDGQADSGAGAGEPFPSFGGPSAGADTRGATTEEQGQKLGGEVTVDIPITETNAPSSGNTPFIGETSTVLEDASGEIGVYAYSRGDGGPSSGFFNTYGTLSNVQITQTTAPDGNLPTMTLSGQYNLDSEYANHLWFLDLDSITSDGTRYVGFAAGAKLGHTLSGNTVLIRINSDNNTWLIQSFGLQGSSDPNELTFTTQGPFYAEPLFDLSGYEYSTSENPYTSGAVADGDFIGHIDVTTKNIDLDQISLGAWKALCAGYIKEGSVTSSSLNAYVGGNDSSYDGRAYWLGALDAHKESTGELSGTMEGFTLNEKVLGYFGGTLTGFSDNTDWQAVAVGVHLEAPLEFVSPITSLLETPQSGQSLTSFGSLDVPKLTGLLGGVEPLWSSDSVDFNFIGTIPQNLPDKYYFWGSDLSSYNYDDGSYTTYDGGWYRGMAGGIFKNSMDAKLRALYVSPDHKIGIISSNFTGAIFKELSIFSTYDFLKRSGGTLTLTKKGENYDIDPTDVPVTELTFETMRYKTPRNASIEGFISSNNSLILSIEGEPWGIWSAEIDGTYRGLAIGEKNWRLGLGGNEYDIYEEHAGCLLGTLSGTEASDGKLSTAFRGWSFSQNTDNDQNNIVITKVTGEGSGYVEVSPEQTVWKAGVIGDWMKVAQFADPEQGLWSQINDFVNPNPEMANVPITEVCSSVLNSTAASGISSATMDISLYGHGDSSWQGIWAALINGTFSETPTSTWNATFQNASDNTNILLTGTSWAIENNQWTANVSGDINGNSLSGQAGGTFDNTAGTFTGAGVGTWESNQQY